MNTTTFEKKSLKNAHNSRPGLIVNGMRLMKLDSIRSKSRTNPSSTENIPKFFNVPEKEITFISEILGKSIEVNK